MILRNLSFKESDEWSWITVQIAEGHFDGKEMYFRVPCAFKDYLCKDRYDAFLVGLIWPAMKYGEDIIIEGTVSHRLLFNMRNYIQFLLQEFAPKAELKRIKIQSDIAPELKTRNNMVGTAFSGGVDSFCTIYDHFELENDEEYKINCLLFQNVGAHGSYEDTRTFPLFIERFKSFSQYPQEVHLPFIMEDSNVQMFLSEWMPKALTQTYSLNMIAGILALQGEIRKYYISSSQSYTENLFFGRFYINTMLDESYEPVLIPLLCTDLIEIISDGVQYRRTEKTVRILDYKPIQKYLNVCCNRRPENVKNCSYCTKCCRTLWTLESADKLELVKTQFDLNIWKKEEFRYKCRQRLISGKDNFAIDNIDFARKNGKSVPTYIQAFIVCMPDMLFKFGKNVLRLFLSQKKYQNIKAWAYKYLKLREF
ncbi:MAG: hypothetical protein LBM77_13455 [Spirochaetaceae bacterium]|jgi:hypothetical protein|nr:hypothetical protein [Spirochaetaceae bacterium]